MYKGKALSISVVLFLGFSSRIAADPIDFTSIELSLGAMLEAGIMTASTFQQAAGQPGSRQLISYAGSMTASSWDLMLSGSYNGNGLGIELTSSSPGTFAANITNSVFAGNPWSESGTFLYQATGVGELSMAFSSNVPFSSGIFDREVSKTWTKSHTDDATHISDTGQYFWTLFGRKVFPGGQAPQVSDYIIPDGSPDHATVSIVLPLENLILNGNTNFIDNTTAGTIEFVPEPSSFVLVLAGALGAASCLRGFSARDIIQGRKWKARN